MCVKEQHLCVKDLPGRRSMAEDEACESCAWHVVSTFGGPCVALSSGAAALCGLVAVAGGEPGEEHTLTVPASVDGCVAACDLLESLSADVAGRRVGETCFIEDWVEVVNAAQYLQSSRLLEVSCRRVAGLLDGLRTCPAARQVLGVTRDMSAEEEREALIEVPWTPRRGDGEAVAYLEVGAARLEADGVEAVLSRCKPSSLLVLKGVSRGWRDAIRYALTEDEDWGRRHGLDFDWATAGRRLGEDLAVPFDVLLAFGTLDRATQGHDGGGRV